jgi:hypothetical protein
MYHNQSNSSEQCVLCGRKKISRKTFLHFYLLINRHVKHLSHLIKINFLFHTSHTTDIMHEARKFIGTSFSFVIFLRSFSFYIYFFALFLLQFHSAPTVTQTHTQLHINSCKQMYLIKLSFERMEDNGFFCSPPPRQGRIKESFSLENRKIFI